MVSLSELKEWKESSDYWKGSFLTEGAKKNVTYHETENHASGQLGGDSENIVKCAVSFLEQNSVIFQCGVIGSEHGEQ